MVMGVKGDLKEEIFNVVNENVKALERIFPSVVKDGQVDFQALKEELGQFEEVGPEKYGLTWSGKQNAKKIAQQDISGKTLKYVPEDSKNPDTTENLYIEGDNLEVLKLLRQNYYGAIKMIYIDPPYNTGNDFVYNDSFSMDKSQSDVEEGEISEIGERYIVNSKSSNKYHANWLNMIYPRLKLSKDLLTDDGVIFISIDDNEQTNLKEICDEIFGEENFIAQIIRNTNSSKNQSLFVSVSHEYCLVYSKNIHELQNKHSDKKWAVLKNNVREYEKKVQDLKLMGLSNDEITEELKLLTKYPRFIDFTNYWYFDERGLYQKDNLGGVKNGNNTPIINPITNRVDPIPPGGFRYTTEKLNNLIKENRIHFHIDGSLPRIKRYLNENLMQRPKSIMSDDQRPDNSLLKEFNTPFDNPKQLSFLKRILSVGDNDSIILDFFSGSASTAHAVMSLNSEDKGNRRYIMVQLAEECHEKSEAYKAGYKNICEIGRARIDKAGEKIKEENKDKEGIENLDIGFKVFRVSDTNIRWSYEYDTLKTLANETTSMSKENQSTFNFIAATSEQVALDEVLSPKDRLDFMPGTRDINVVYEILLRQRDIPLSAKVELLEDIGNRTYIFADSYVVCLETEITEELIEKLAAINPLPIKYILRDSAFGDDIELKDETYRRLQALIERNTGESKKAYTVEFI